MITSSINSSMSLIEPVSELIPKPDSSKVIKTSESSNSSSSSSSSSDLSSDLAMLFSKLSLASLSSSDSSSNMLFSKVSSEIEADQKRTLSEAALCLTNRELDFMLTEFPECCEPLFHNNSALIGSVLQKSEADSCLIPTHTPIWAALLKQQNSITSPVTLDFKSRAEITSTLYKGVILTYIMRRSD